MAHRRSQSEGVADGRERISAPPAAQRHSGHWRERIVTFQNVAAPDARSRTDQRARPENRNEACLRSLRRRFDFAPFCFRAIHHGLGARSVLELMRRAENARAHQAHAQDGEAVAKLSAVSGYWILDTGYWISV